MSSDDNSLEIVAECGQGYAGNVARALTLVDYAAAACADVVKFQLVYADELATPGYEHYELFQELEMPTGAWERVAEQCRARGVGLSLDIFGTQSLRVAESIAAAIKVHSTDLLNIGLLEEVAGSEVRMVMLSAGGAFPEEIERAAEILKGKHLTLIHGFQGYPTPNEANQLGRLAWLREAFPQHRAAFADHVPCGDPARLWLSAVAVGAGATVLEKHLTTAVLMEEEDFEAALNPDDFAGFVANMRLAHAAREAPTWKGEAALPEAELAYRELTKKHVVAQRDLERGQRLGPEDVALKRTGLTEDVIHDPIAVVDRTLTAPVREDDPITAEVLS